MDRKFRGGDGGRYGGVTAITAALNRLKKIKIKAHGALAYFVVNDV